MTRNEYLKDLEKRLSSLPSGERESYLQYCGEMIDGRMDDGMSEEAAVESLGSVDAMAADFIKEQPKSNGIIYAVYVIFLWLGMAIAWFICIDFAGVGVGCAFSAVASFIKGTGLSAWFYVGTSLASLGLFVLLLMVCISRTRYAARLTKRVFGGGLK